MGNVIVPNITRTPVSNGSNWGSVAATPPSGDAVYSGAFALTGGGRISFVESIYESTSAPWTETILIERTHGSVGAVEATVSLDGVSQGTVSWLAGEIGRVSIDVTVSSFAGTGQEDSVLTMAITSGTAVLHRGAYEKAWMIIDDNSEDVNAIWVDAAAAGGGNGSKSTPYNDIDDAFDAYIVLADPATYKSIYLKGAFSASTQQHSLLGDLQYRYKVPNLSTTEATRLRVRNAPSETASINASDNGCGFFAKDGQSFISFAGIDFLNISDASPNSASEGIAAIAFSTVKSTDIVINRCTINKVTGGTGGNNGGVYLWLSEGVVVNNCAIQDIAQSSPRVHNANNCGVYMFSATSTTINHCEISNAADAIYQKKSASQEYLERRQSSTVRFCRLYDCSVEGFRFGQQGGGEWGHCYGLVQQTIFSDTGYAVVADRDYTAVSSEQGEKNVIQNCTFDATSSSAWVLSTRRLHDWIMLNNIIQGNIAFNRFVDDPPADAIPPATSSGDLELMDHTAYYRGAGSSAPWRFAGTSYTTIAQVQANTVYEANGTDNVDPNFIDDTNVDYLLRNYRTTADIIGGMSIRKGAYITNLETIGVQA